MKILQINKFLYHRGGAEKSCLELGQILEEHGHEVAYFSTKDKRNLKTKWNKYFIKSYDLGNTYNFSTNIKVGFEFIYNFRARKNLRKLIQEFRPDIAHLHNTYHHLSPSIIDELKKNKIPIVLTLRDYKVICPNRNMEARGEIWEKSKKHKYYKCFFDKCIKDSYLRSLLVTIEAYFHWFKKSYGKVDAFISPSQFLINKFKEFGFKREIIHLPNPLVNLSDIKKVKIGDYILHFGRLTPEKGVDDLIKAYNKVDTNLKLYIVGDGSEKSNLEKLAKNNKNIIFTGHKIGNELWDLVKGARFLVFSPKWYDNAPRAIIEAMALGKAVVASRMGGIPEWVHHNKTGFLFKSGDIKELIKLMNFLLKKDNKFFESIGKNAKELVYKKNDKDIFYKEIIKIYTSLVK
jgi:glycosyltransferase involved in cell wall biosynthesis